MTDFTISSGPTFRSSHAKRYVKSLSSLNCQLSVLLMLPFLEAAEAFSVEFQKGPDRGRDTEENLQNTMRPEKSLQSEEIIYLGEAGQF